MAVSFGDTHSPNLVFFDLETTGLGVYLVTFSSLLKQQIINVHHHLIVSALIHLNFPAV